MLLAALGDSCRRAPALTAVVPADEARLPASLRTRRETASSTMAETNDAEWTAWLDCVAWLRGLAAWLGCEAGLREVRRRRPYRASCDLSLNSNGALSGLQARAMSRRAPQYYYFISFHFIL